ncbi:MAG: MMPL family transporter [Planctomycetota bacterium]
MMPDDGSLRRHYFRRLAIGVALLAMLAVPAAIHSKAAIDSLHNSPADWLPDGVPVKARFNEFSERFDVSDLLLISWPGATLESTGVDRAGDLLRPLCRQNDADDRLVEVQTEALPAWAGTFREQIRRLCDDHEPLTWCRSGTETLRRLTASPVRLSDRVARRRLAGTLVGPDGSQTCLLVSLERSASDRRRELLPRMRQAIARLCDVDVQSVAMVGGPLDGATVDTESIRSIDTFSPPSSLIAAVLCLLCLRSIPLTAAIVSVAVIGQGMVLAMVYYTGRDMNAVLIVLPPLVFVLTVSAGIHMSNYFLDIVREFPGQAKSASAFAAMRAGVMPCCLATATTVVGLSSLLLVRLEPVRIFGAVASLGVAMTLSLLILILPGAMLLSGSGKKTQTRSGDRDRPSTVESPGGVARFVRKRLLQPWPIILGFAALSFLTACGLGGMTSSVNVPRMFLPESDIRRQYDWFEEHLGPTATGDIVLEYPDDDSDRLQRLAEVSRVHAAMLQVPAVGGVLSPATFLPAIPKSRRLSDAGTRSVIRRLVADPESSVGKLGYIARQDGIETWRVTVRLHQSGDANFGPRIAAITRAARMAVADLESPPAVSMTGHVVVVESSQQILLSDLFKSFVAAFGIIAIVMVVMLRSLVGGLLAMLPNLFPTLMLFGTMGWLAIPLDIGSVMSASVALGIAVDDTVHLLSRFGSRRQRGLGQIRAAFGALSQCGMAMAHTTIVCGFALMAYYFSDFVPTSRFALFMFALLASALLGVLILLPAMMASRLGRFLSRGAASDPEATVYADVEPVLDTRRL